MDNDAIHKANFGFTTNTSRCLVSFSYEADDYYGQKGDVTATFTTGGTYLYENVYFSDAMAVFMAYVNEESVGNAFVRFIRDKCEAKKIGTYVVTASNNR